MLIGLTEFLHLGYNEVNYFGFLIVIYMGIMLVMTRVHYVADIYCGLLMGSYMHWISVRYEVYIDKLFSLPFLIVFKMYRFVKQCFKIHIKTEENSK
jgi:hypothetical protein